MTGEDFRAQSYSSIETDIQSELPEDIVFEEGIPVIAETPAAPAPETIDDSPNPGGFENETGEAEERMRIQNMSAEETMKYLAQSLNEINSFDFSGEDGGSDYGDIENLNNISWLSENPPPAPQAASPQALFAAAAHDLPTVDESPKQLTVEPFWGDIYIKASRNLRELCENGKLSMPQIETELKEKLLEAAEQFAAVTKDESKIPKSLLPKITELKAAVGNTEPYFQLGEDIAARAMFFMLYQMLSYADRIAETPETKEKFNDFFRRFGPAGISLSMLDVRV